MVNYFAEAPASTNAPAPAANGAAPQPAGNGEDLGMVDEISVSRWFIPVL